VGSFDGFKVGKVVGTSVGKPDGSAVGKSVGSAVGSSVGSAVGSSVGSAVGSSVGSSVGHWMSVMSIVAEPHRGGFWPSQAMYSQLSSPTKPGLAVYKIFFESSFPMAQSPLAPPVTFTNFRSGVSFLRTSIEHAFPQMHFESASSSSITGFIPGVGMPVGTKVGSDVGRKVGKSVGW